ncbi:MULTISPECIES: alkaline phosphatase family protein [Mesorhizobium]|uniref:Type I phosphodiesterase / nucleotide pyrophosphatase n=1 Tax=Mesorhizobium qingshengii TaxID=1165689 RepID=A0A1G5ZY99_9HYPH|nr:MULTISPECIES: alkaline phosphatase family protein [Mesorhizobium]MCH4561247.1 alkaline phosphatase family protein [Mesorhizobium jarvisii]QGU21170.1 alkaline phosphatase family protein [Mesorhizobium huakuii 7653R]SDA99682.1 Type I phosphodiesterase / nucleotide pyrophosphatase [Mesorhizobium qingshengii]
MTNEVRHVVVMGIDGLRPDLVDEITMPNLVALANAGTWSTHHTTVFPSETRGALTALATGSPAQTNGIAGNQFYVRDGFPEQIFTETVHDWYAADERLGGQLVEATSLSETLHRVGQPFAVIASSGPGVLPALNWKGAQRDQLGFNVRHPQTAHPHEFAARVHRSLRIPAGGVSADGPRAALRVFEQEVWPHSKPAVSILWCTEVDSAAHLYGLGSDQLREKIRVCDEVVGALMAWREAQPERNSIALLVVSDHGHVTIGGLVSVADSLCAGGFKAAASFADAATDILVRPGRAAGVWLRRHDPVLLQEVASFMTEQAWFGGAFSCAGVPGSIHGRVEGSLALELLGAGGARAPDLFVQLGSRVNDDVAGGIGSVYYDAGDNDLRPGGGTHGGLHRGELFAALAGYGAGLGQGRVSTTPSAITDIAPTILSLLGVPQPQTMTGRVLRELMAEAPTEIERVSEDIRSSGTGKVTVLSGMRAMGRFYMSESRIVPAT